MPRPKSPDPLPTASQRVKKSLDTLIASGGRRFNLRLNKDGNEALKKLMESGTFADETTAINEALVALEKAQRKKRG